MLPNGRPLNQRVPCVFCDIVSGTSPAEILCEGPTTVTILDVNPIHFGHALVIPRRHYPTLIDAPENELDDLMHAVHRISKALVEGLSLEGFNFFANNGAIAGQSVFHFHVHVTPRYAHDNIRFMLELKHYEGDSMREIAGRIRSAITRT
jgi:histidine triad (HIT) family protein